MLNYYDGVIYIDSSTQKQIPYFQVSPEMTKLLEEKEKFQYVLEIQVQRPLCPLNLQ